MRRIKGTIGATCLTVLVAGAVTACGSSSDGSASAGGDPAAGQVNQAARAKLPNAVRSAGTLKVATSLQWPPFGFKGDGGQPDGFDLDLMKAISARLGLKTSITDVKFDSIVPSVQNGRFDVGVNELGDIPERRKIVQFVDYYDGGIAVLVPKGQTSDIGPTNLCGHTMSLTQGSSQVELGKRISKQCVSDGKPAINFKLFSDSASTILAVSNRRVEGFMTDYAVGVYLTRTTNKTLSVLPGIVPDSTDRAGIVIGKDNGQLAGAIQAALQSMIDDGSYAKVLDKWGLSDRAVKRATINDNQGSGT
jgi:polar amino acid transport system substrate-binding protein